MLSSLKMMSMSPCTVLNGRFPTYAVNGGSVGSSFCFLGPPEPLPPRGLMGGGTEDRETGTQVKRIVGCRGQTGPELKTTTLHTLSSLVFQTGSARFGV